MLAMLSDLEHSALSRARHTVECMSAQTIPQVSDNTSALLSHLHAVCFPAGLEAARCIRAIRSKQKGEMRMSPGSRWIPFVAEEFVDATRSSFRWEARLDPGKLSGPTVIDAYDGGHGQLTVKIGGVLPVKKIAGPDMDQGELQRYLCSIILCPSILLNHPSLEIHTAGPSTLRLSDRQDVIEATIDLDFSGVAGPIACYATRPRMVGKRAVLTLWSGIARRFRDYEGVRIATQFEVAWHLPEGPFTYFREEITSWTVVH